MAAFLGVPAHAYYHYIYFQSRLAPFNPIRAQFNLAQIYGNGDEGVPQNLPRALMWFSAASTRLVGDQAQIARDNMAEVARAMTPAQRTEAQTLARQCEADFAKCE